jgi:hypothetical protein
MTNKQNSHVIFVDEPEELTTYTYISNHIHLPTELQSLLGEQSLSDVHCNLFVTKIITVIETTTITAKPKIYSL